MSNEPQVVEIKLHIDNRDLHTKHHKEVIFRATGEAIRIRFLDSPFHEEHGVEEVITIEAGQQKKLKVKKENNPNCSRAHFYTVEAVRSHEGESYAAVPCIIVNGNGDSH